MIVLAGADVRSLLHHMALYGLGTILEEGGVPELVVRWTAGARPVPQLDGLDLTADVVDRMVRAHAARHADPSSWVQQNLGARGLMSPRLATIGDRAAWEAFQQARHAVLDRLTGERASADLRYLAALGEPAYWSHNRKGDPLQDDGASRLEMQPRNQGSEFVGSRLRKVAAVVAARVPGVVVGGLVGDLTMDEAGSGKADSRTPAGFASPGPTDNALAWCALWGLGQLPIVPRVDGTAVTSGHVGRSREEWFFVPVWTSSWTIAKMRTVLASRALRNAAASGLDRWAATRALETAAKAWLGARGVDGVVRFPISRFGSDSAPERRAMRGDPIAVTW